jgi:hypothetical protein
MNGYRAFLAVVVLGLVATGFPKAGPDNEKAKALAALAKERLEAAHKTYEVMWANYREGRRVSDDTLYRWSLRWLEAERQVGQQPAEQVAAFQGHRNRMADLERLIRGVRRVGQATVDELSAAVFYRTEADFWLLQADAGKKGP